MSSSTRMLRSSKRALSSDAELAHLVRRMAGGDESALAELWDRTSPVVLAHAMQVLDDRGAAEEATLDCYSQAWREAGRFDAARGSAFAWLISMARSRVIDRLRIAGGAVRRREAPLDLARGHPSGEPSPPAASWIGERRDAILGALARLPGEQLESIRCAFFRGMSHSQIARHLNQPLGTIKTRIRTALLRLRAELEPLRDEP